MVSVEEEPGATEGRAPGAGAGGRNVRGDTAGGLMTETEDSRNDFSSRKRAFERHRRAQEAVTKAREAKRVAQSVMLLELELEVLQLSSLNRMEQRSEDPAMLEGLKKQEEELKSKRTQLQEEWRKSDDEEQQALAELAEASQQLEELTVEPRVEGLKLRFEASTLEATLSTGVVVGLATVTKLLLPSEPAYPWLSWLAYAAFLLALVGSLYEMRTIAKRVENVLISGREVVLSGFKEKLKRGLAKVGIHRLRIPRWAFPIGLLLFVVFVTLNLGLGQVSADSAVESNAPVAESNETAPACLFAPPFC
jgi:hypothetical protein